MLLGGRCDCEIAIEMRAHGMRIPGQVDVVRKGVLLTRHGGVEDMGWWIAVLPKIDIMQRQRDVGLRNVGCGLYKTNLETSLAGVALLLLAPIGANLASGRLSARRFSLATSHFCGLFVESRGVEYVECDGQCCGRGVRGWVQIETGCC